MVTYNTLSKLLYKEFYNKFNDYCLLMEFFLFFHALGIRYNHLDFAQILNKPSLIQFYISPHLHKVQQYYPRYINI